MDDLVAWLTQILDEDEQAVKRSFGSVVEMQNDNYGRLLVPKAWMLARIAADRNIVAWCTERDQVWVGTLGSDPTDPKNYAPGSIKRPSDSVVLRLLAEANDDRPGYREEWRP